MRYSNYSEVEDAIRERREFRGNSCQGVFIDGDYVVLSYNTVIAKATRCVVAGAERDGELWVNPKGYSKTTSRLQNIVKRAWEVK